MTPSGEERPKEAHRLFLPPPHLFATGRNSAGFRMRLRLAPVAPRLVKPHPCLLLLRSMFPYQHRTEQATPVLRHIHTRMPLRAWIMQTRKHTPTNPTVVPHQWCPLLVLYHRRSVMFVHKETKLAYHMETSITTKTAMPTNPSQVSGEFFHVDAVDRPVLAALLALPPFVTTNVHYHTLPAISSPSNFDIPPFTSSP